MTEAIPTALAAATPDTASTECPGSITTRFGELAVDPDKVITFDQGLYGLEDQRHFLLTSVPGWPDFFKLLQSVDDPRLGLIVLPLDDGDGPIDPADVADACRTLGYDPQSTALIGIVTMREDGGDQVFTVNMKAPVLIDSGRREGRQYVFTSERYQLRHPLASDPKTGG